MTPAPCAPALVFPETFKTTNIHITQDNLVVVKGIVDYKEDTPKIIAESFIPINKVPSVLIHNICLNITSLTQKKKELDRIKQIILDHPGDTPVHLEMPSKKGISLKIKAEAGVDVTASLISELENILGKDDVCILMKK